MSLHATRKAITTALAGRMPDEGTLRAARSEIEQAEKKGEAVLISSPGAEPNISLEETMKALAGIFFVMENTMVKMRKEGRGNLVIESAVADAYIDAKKVLTKYGYESVVQRKDPLTLTPLKAR